MSRWIWTMFSGNWGRLVIDLTISSVSVETASTLAVADGHGDARDRLARLGPDVEAVLVEADLLEHEDEDHEAEARALGGVEDLLQGLLEARVLARARELVVDADVFLLVYLDVVPHLEDDIGALGLEDDLDVVALLLLLLQVPGDVVHRVLLEAEHALLVLVRVVDVEAPRIEVHALGVGLLGVDRQLPEAVDEVVLELLLAELAEEDVEDFFHIHFDVVGEGIRQDIQGDGVVRRPLDLGDVDYEFACAHARPPFTLVNVNRFCFIIIRHGPHFNIPPRDQSPKTAPSGTFWKIA